MSTKISVDSKHLMAVVENSHRCADEYFLMIHAERCKNYSYPHNSI